MDEPVGGGSGEPAAGAGDEQGARSAAVEVGVEGSLDGWGEGGGASAAAFAVQAEDAVSFGVGDMFDVAGQRFGDP